jgi:aspartyl-tRNA(Asn)/glutamyl-tRNA(Gln) amidotransferase subunit A
MDSVFFYRNPNPDASGNGPLGHLSIATQPNISIAGWPAEAGSHALAGYTALEDASVAARLRKKGANLCGATRMSEFGFGLKNSLAAQAVQKGDANAELVLDLAGECRLAAAHEGLCGYKPSYGLVSRYGLIGLIPSMEACGIIARDCKTIRDILEAVAGPDEYDFSVPEDAPVSFSAQGIDPEKISLGVIEEARSALSDEDRVIFDARTQTLKKAGFTIKTLPFPDFSLFSLVHRIVGSVEASSCLGRYDSVRYGKRVPGAKNWNEMYLQSRGAAFGPLLKSYLFQGAYFQFEQFSGYEDACRIRARLLSEMEQLTTQADFLILPAVNSASIHAPDTTESLDDTYAKVFHTAFTNVTGQPAFYLPFERNKGVQLAGPRLSDARLLALGEHIQNMQQRGQ